MSDTQIEPPVMKDGKIVVRCSNSGCPRTVKMGVEVDAVESRGGRDNWRVSFIPTADGRLEVDTAECPEHRVDDAIDSLAEEQIELAKSMAQTKEMVDKISP